MIETMKKQYQTELSATQGAINQLQVELEQAAARREQLKGAIFALDQLTQAKEKRQVVPTEAVSEVQPDTKEEVDDGQESA